MNIIRNLVALGTLLLCWGLGAPTRAAELAAVTDGDRDPSYRAEARTELNQPIGFATAKFGTTLHEQPRVFETASLAHGLDLMGIGTVDGQRLRAGELIAVFSRSSLHLGAEGLGWPRTATDPGPSRTTSRVFACDLQILPIPLTLAGSEHTDGLLLVVF